MNCDPVARVYRWIEYAAFGKRLEKHRLQFLDATRHSRRALLLGDGDGRFLAALVKSNPLVQVDSLELSAKMIEVARGRVTDSTRVTWVQGDVRQLEFAHGEYDLIVTNFFLDCFSQCDVEALAKRIRGAAAPAAQWIITEFRQPDTGWRAWHARCWLRTMYWFFRMATRLKIQQLPDYRSGPTAQGFRLRVERTSMAGLIGSEIWSLT